jgi:hypothetical protein
MAKRGRPSGKIREQTIYASYNQQTRFVCRICGIEARQAVLCTKDDCLTPILINCAASPRKQ